MYEKIPSEFFATAKKLDCIVFKETGEKVVIRGLYSLGDDGNISMIQILEERRD